MPELRRGKKTAHGSEEGGAVIVEFAAVAVLFLMLLAGLVTYGMIFAVQQSLSHATAESARSVVGITSKADAEERVSDVLDEQLAWLGGTASEGLELEPLDWDACDGSSASCLEVTATYDGSMLGLFPYEIAVPDVLTSSAVIQHDVEGP